MNWTSGVAQGLVKHGTEGGLDAWRKLYHKYIPLADDLHNILIGQLMSIRPVNEGDMESLFDEIERIREFYIKAGSRSYAGTIVIGKRQLAAGFTAHRATTTDAGLPTTRYCGTE